MKYVKFRPALALVLSVILLLGTVGGIPAVSAAEEAPLYIRPMAGDVAQIAVSEDHIAVLRSDGTVTAAGNNRAGQCNVSGWSGIVKIWACKGATVGLTRQGTMVSTCCERPWKDLVDLAVDRFTNPDVIVIVGLRADGTAVSAGANENGIVSFSSGACNVSSWKNVKQIVVQDGIYGLCADGKVLWSGFNNREEPENPVTDWTGVRELVSSGGKVFGITDRGAVLSESRAYGCEKWKNVRSVVAGSEDALYGITANGKVVSGGEGALDCASFADVRELVAGANRLIALKEDGTTQMSPEPSITWTRRESWNNVQSLVISPDGAQAAALKRDGGVVCADLENMALSAGCDGWTNIARLFCGGSYWLGLKHDGTLICTDPSMDVAPLTADVRDTRPQVSSQNMLAAGVYHSVYIRSDGSVAGAGQSSMGRLNVESWSNIVAVSANSHTVGLRSDGTVVAVGPNGSNQCKVGSWKDVVDISAGSTCTIGLTSKGTVLMTGSNKYGQMDMEGRKNVVDVEAGSNCVYALTEKGTVIFAGSNSYGQKRVEKWSNIADISAGSYHVVGLKADGTVVAAGSNQYGQCDVESWKDIVAVSAGGTHTIGLKSDGTLIVAGGNAFGQCDVLQWQDVIAISTGMYHTIAITASGDILATGSNSYGQCDLGF